MPRYRQFYQSQGELCTLPGVPDGITYEAVGTSQCRTCLCVYVKFDDDSVFIAHMSAETMSLGESSSSELPVSSQGRDTPAFRAKWTSGPEKGERLTDLVLKQLSSSLVLGSKKAVEGFVVCPAIKWDGSRANGWYMRRAIEKFFQRVTITTHNGHGFVAGPNLVSTVIGWEGNSIDAEPKPDDTEKLPESYGWESCGQHQMVQETFDTMQMGPWAFCCINGEWSLIRDEEEKIRRDRVEATKSSD